MTSLYRWGELIIMTPLTHSLTHSLTNPAAAGWSTTPST